MRGCPYIKLIYTGEMRNKSFLVRVSNDEKLAFEFAASLVGLSLSSWVRERLRHTAIRELEGVGWKVPFVPDVPLEGSKKAED